LQGMYQGGYSTGTYEIIEPPGPKLRWLWLQRVQNHPRKDFARRRSVEYARVGVQS